MPTCVASVPDDALMVTSGERCSFEASSASLNDGLVEGNGATVPWLDSAGSVGKTLKSMKAFIF